MPTITDQYNSNLAQMQGAYNPLSMPEQTLQGITDQLASVYRPQLEQAILSRYGATKKQKAAIDVDAASRGMGTSTWVTDAKNRIMNAEAADIAGLESDYASRLAGDALQQYNNYLADKQNLDRYNQSLAIQLGNTAYDRAMDQYARGMVEGTLPAQQQQLAYDQAAWQFGQAQRDADFNSRANELAYQQNAWNFDRAQQAAGLEDQQRQLAYDQALWNFGQAQRDADFNSRANELAYNQNAWAFGRQQQQAPLQDQQNQLAYDQALWQFQRAQQQAPLDDKAAQLAYDNDYLTYLRNQLAYNQGQWEFDQARSAAAAAARGGGYNPYATTKNPDTDNDFEEQYRQLFGAGNGVTPDASGSALAAIIGGKSLFNSNDKQPINSANGRVGGGGGARDNLVNLVRPLVQ